MFWETRESMLRQTLHVRVVNDTQKILTVIGPNDVVCYDKKVFDTSTHIWLTCVS